MGRRKGDMSEAERKARSDRMKPHPAKGNTAKYLKHALQSANYPEINLDDEQAVKDRINLYFEDCIKDDCKPGMEGMANALGVNGRQLNKWMDGEERKGQFHGRAVKKGKQILSELMESYMQNGEINPIVGIFYSANNYGMEQKVSHEVQVQPALSTDLSPQQLENRYGNSIDAEITEHAEDTKKEG